MRTLSLRLLMVSSLVFTSVFISGCGGTNNNNGTVLSLIGFFPEDNDGSCNGTGLVGVTVPMSDVSGTETPGSTGRTLVGVGVLNSLVGQTVRLTRIEMDYFVPEANSQPPSTFNPMPLLLGPADGGDDGIGTSLPESFNIIPNCSVANVELITPAVSQWINLNRGSLPPPPFVMYVTTNVVGQSSAGSVLYSNQSTVRVNITPDVIIPPTEGEEAVE
jgi:hypothetical protein